MINGKESSKMCVSAQGAELGPTLFTLSDSLRTIYLHLSHLQIRLCTLMTLQLSVYASRKTSLVI